MNEVVGRRFSIYTVSINKPTKQCFATLTLDKIRHVNVGVAEVCMWLGPSHTQAKDNEKNSGVDGSLTRCGDAQKESENMAFIPVFDPIQSVKSTKTVMLRYTRVSQKSGISTLASLRSACGLHLAGSVSQASKAQ